jgi:hypothetical protein
MAAATDKATDKATKHADLRIYNPKSADTGAIPK